MGNVFIDYKQNDKTISVHKSSIVKKNETKKEEYNSLIK